VVGPVVDDHKLITEDLVIPEMVAALEAQNVEVVIV